MQMPLYREVRPVVISFIDTGGASLRGRRQGLAAERPGPGDEGGVGDWGWRLGRDENAGFSDKEHG